MDSILDSIKKLLGIAEDYTQFDADIVMHINSVFSVLTQLGVGPTTGFAIVDNSDEWTDFISDNAKLSSIKSYIYLRVRLLFDPPASSTITNAIKDSIDELEWRLMVTADPISSS